ncbi:uncharacterized protein AKAW2_30549S [Aspergillus luchuensis]|uniref:Uncharacterized protein n=1 Tax=Aspergillus kawachii TaxID=1069201 RepID=A0A7R7WV41_ASPKA|nr:uncharacterized protein AKAW2_30549S [Aspergillus luchuensis]BCR97230.1 hypothetical protein AKAW2_30549S [Aspergillus luchuensis]BCS09697.1 hypothetical protein ALUC_30514S [Aspergillus luchuensis]
MRASLTRAHAASSLLLHPPPHPTSSLFLLPFCLIPLSSWLFLATTTRGLSFLPHLDSSFLSGHSSISLPPSPPPLSSLGAGVQPRRWYLINYFPLFHNVPFRGCVPFWAG